MSLRKFVPFFILSIFSIALIQTGCDTLVTESNTVRVYDSSIAVDCFDCHRDTDNPLLRPQGQFENSAHANFDLLDTDGCLTACHTHEGFLHMLDTLAKVSDPFNPDSYSAITCYTCHLPHDINTPYGEWDMDTIRGVELTPTFVSGFGSDLGKSNNCATCHKARKDESVAGLANAGDFAPHFSPQADIVSGRNGAFLDISSNTDPTDSTNVLASGHFENGCIKCHYGAPGLGQGYKFAEHSFRLKDPDTDEMYFNTCQDGSCHGGNMNQDFVDSSQYLISIAALADTVRMFLEAFEVLDPSDTTGRTVNTATTRSLYLDSALYNFFLYSYDNSKGIHNPIFIKELLDTTKTVLDSLPPLIDFIADAPDNCLNGTITFTPTVIGTFDTLLWNYGDGVVDTILDENPVTHSYTTSGDFSVALTALSYYTQDSLNEAGDSIIYDTVLGSDTELKNDFVSIEALISPSFAIDTNGNQFTTPITVCIGDSLHFVSTSTIDDDSPTFTWNFGYGTDEIISTDSITHVFDTVGTLSPMLAISTNCYDTSIMITNLVTVEGAKAIIDPNVTIDYATFADSAILSLNHLSIGSVDSTIWVYSQPDNLTSTDTSFTAPFSVTYARPATDSLGVQFILRVTSSHLTCTSESLDTLTIYIDGLTK